MKRTFSIIAVIAFILALCSCSIETINSKIAEPLDKLTESLGGNVIVYRKGDTNIHESIISLYGKGETAPDELEFAEFAAIWYSDRLISADAGVFYVTNVADIPSVVKMCSRRAETLKRTAGIAMKTEIHGHYVCAYTAGIPELENAIKSCIK